MKEMEKGERKTTLFPFPSQLKNPLKKVGHYLTNHHRRRHHQHFLHPEHPFALKAHRANWIF